MHMLISSAVSCQHCTKGKANKIDKTGIQEAEE